MEQWPLTQHSLLVRIRDAGDHAAWRRFVDTYGPFLYEYARRQGLQDADAADVTQEVLRRVCKAMADFRYDPDHGTFRGWLFTIARNALRTFLVAKGRREQGSGNTNFQRLLEQLPTEDADSQVWDEQYERHLLMVAAGEVRDSFVHSTWQAFWQTAVEGNSAKEVAQSLGISVGAVYVAKCRVLAQIRRELACIAALD